MVAGARDTRAMSLDDTVADRLLARLERVETLLNDLDRLADDSDEQEQHQRIRAEMRRELEAAEKEIGAIHDAT